MYIKNSEICTSCVRFNSKDFNKALEHRLSHLINISYDDFKTVILKEQNRYVPLKGNFF